MKDTVTDKMKKLKDGTEKSCIGKILTSFYLFETWFLKKSNKIHFGGFLEKIQSGLIHGLNRFKPGVDFIRQPWSDVPFWLFK